MSASIKELNKRRNLFWWIFVGSFCIAMLPVVWMVIQDPTILDPHSDPFPKPVDDVSGSDLAIILSVISLLTSLVALLGFFSTTILAWRKEKRDVRHSELELTKKELEIRKLQTELKICDDKPND